MSDQENENESYISKCVQIEEPVKMLQMYVAEMRGLSRKKREARDKLQAMKYHARNLMLTIGSFERYLE